MYVRNIVGAWILCSTLALLGCHRASSTDDAHDEELQTEQEQEPNNDREHCETLAENATLVGELTASDSDVICPDSHPVLYVAATRTISMALQDQHGQRVELGQATGVDSPLRVAFPAKDWVLELRGHGSWQIEGPQSTDAAADETYCGIQLGRESAPVVLGAQQLPAVFPICAEAALGNAQIQLPTLRPENVVGFEIGVDGLDDQSRGTLHVRDQGENIATLRLQPGARLPALRWTPQSLLSANLMLAHQGTPKTMYLRIDPVVKPDDARHIVELEPNDTPSQAIDIRRPGVIAGELYSLQDADWYRLNTFAGDMGIKVMVPDATHIRVQSVLGDTHQDAEKDDEGAYRICALGSSQAQPAMVRIAYADDATATNGLYQLTFLPATDTTDTAFAPDDVVIPQVVPKGNIGFVDASESVSDHRNGRIFPASAVQAWVFRVPQTQGQARVDIHADTQSTIDLAVRVLDADHVAVATANRTSAGQAERLHLELPTGYYILEVKARGVTGCNGTYSLAISSPDVPDTGVVPDENATGVPQKNVGAYNPSHMPHNGAPSQDAHPNRPAPPTHATPKAPSYPSHDTDHHADRNEASSTDKHSNTQDSADQDPGAVPDYPW